VADLSNGLTSGINASRRLDATFAIANPKSSFTRAPAGWPTRSIMDCHPSNNEDNEMTIASGLLQQHIQTLVDDNARWQTLIADNILWELAYAPSLGHPAQLSGREEAVRHATWFVGAVENFRFFDLKVYALADPQGAVAEVKGEGLIKSTGRVYRQDYVVFLRAVDGRIAFLREYFDPVRAANALNTPILGLKS
jgi:ketosteroid isomerase-like protein